MDILCAIAKGVLRRWPFEWLSQSTSSYLLSRE